MDSGAVDPISALRGAIMQGVVANPGLEAPSVPFRGEVSQGVPGREAAVIKEAAEGFETYFIYTLLKEMRKTIPDGGLMGPGIGKGMYEAMFDDAIAKSMAKQGGIGLGKFITESLRVPGAVRDMPVQPVLDPDIHHR